MSLRRTPSNKRDSSDYYRDRDDRESKRPTMSSTPSRSIESRSVNIDKQQGTDLSRPERSGIGLDEDEWEVYIFINL